MKKYSIILMAAIAVAMAGFYSCDKKTGDPDNPDNPDIPGDGSPNNPFKVVTVMDLKRVGTGEEGPGGFKWNRDKFYKQLRDIDLKSEAVWTPISPYESNFSGTYDGCGRTISNLTITGEKEYQGLFGYTRGNIFNVRLKKVSISGSGSVGCLIGQMASGTVEHCSVEDFEIWGKQQVGGIVGRFSGGTINACIVTDGKVHHIGPTMTTGWCGGVAGFSATGTIKNCYTAVDVDGAEYVAGIVGAINGNTTTVMCCYATGNVMCNGRGTAGIVGESSGNIKNCVALNREVKNTSTSFNDNGRISGKNFNTGTMSDNFARNDMSLRKNESDVPLGADVGLTKIHGESISSAEYHSAGWWKNTAGFPDSEWTFEDGKLPRLKGFDGLTQNPTIN